MRADGCSRLLQTVNSIFFKKSFRYECYDGLSQSDMKLSHKNSLQASVTEAMELWCAAVLQAR